MICKYCFGEVVSEAGGAQSVCTACGAVNSGLAPQKILEIMRNIVERASANAVQNMRKREFKNDSVAEALPGFRP